MGSPIWILEFCPMPLKWERGLEVSIIGDLGNWGWCWGIPWFWFCGSAGCCCSGCCSFCCGSICCGLAAIETPGISPWDIWSACGFPGGSILEFARTFCDGFRDTFPPLPALKSSLGGCAETPSVYCAIWPVELLLGIPGLLSWLGGWWFTWIIFSWVWSFMRYPSFTIYKRNQPSS